jgi:ribose 5-phosphate isomerase A
MQVELTALMNRALDCVPDGARIGLGSGRTVGVFLRALGERVRQGLRIRSVPASESTAQLARDYGIPLDTLARSEPLAITIDGADEVERHTLNALKGWGGALVRERIVAAAARQQVLLITRNKLVDRLGTRGKLPVEVLPFAAAFCLREVEKVPVPGGLRPILRYEGPEPYVTDNGNWIYDCALQPLDDPAGVYRALRAIPGVIDAGLFLGTASVVLVADGENVVELRNPEREALV